MDNIPTTSGLDYQKGEGFKWSEEAVMQISTY